MSTGNNIPIWDADGDKRDTSTLLHDLGDGSAHIQDVGVAGELPDGTPVRVGLGLSGGARVAPAVPIIGTAGPWPGVSATSYSSGAQVGDPVPAAVNGVELEPGEVYVVGDVRVSVTDLEGQLDGSARLWLVGDLGGGLGDAGDGATVDFTGGGGFTRTLAQPYRVAQAPDGTPEVHTFGAGIVQVTFDLHPIRLSPIVSFVLEVGAAATWASTASLSFVLVGTVLDYTPPTP